MDVDPATDIPYLLTATRSARKSLALDAPVDLADIRECLRIGLQAANGRSAALSWRLSPPSAAYFPRAVW